MLQSQHSPTSAHALISHSATVGTESYSGDDDIPLAEREATAIHLCHQILSLAVTPYQDRSRSEIEELSGYPIVSKSIADYFEKGISTGETADQFHKFLDMIRDDLLISPIAISKFTFEEDDYFYGGVKARVHKDGSEYSEKNIKGITRDDAREMLEIVRDYRSVHPSIIWSVVDREVLKDESVFDASVRWLNYFAGENDYPLSENALGHLICTYLSQTNYTDLPPDIRTFFERKIADIFDVRDIYMYTRSGLNLYMTPVIVVDTAQQLFAQAKNTQKNKTLSKTDGSIERATITNDHVNHTPPTEDKIGESCNTAHMLIDEHMVDEFMRLLEMRL